MLTTPEPAPRPLVRNRNITPNERLRQYRHVLALLAVFSLLQSPITGAATQFDLTGRVVRVADGDTVTILDDKNIQHKLRLYGIDTPERAQPFGKAAKNALVQLIDNKPVGVIIVTRDSYGREVGTLYRDRININEAMVASGYAWWYQYYAPYSRTLQAAEQQARKQRLGLWAQPDPVAPWEWRRKKR